MKRYDINIIVVKLMEIIKDLDTDFEKNTISVKRYEKIHKILTNALSELFNV